LNTRSAVAVNCDVFAARYIVFLKLSTVVRAMSEKKSAPTPEAMIESYQELLRRLIADADDEEKLFAFRKSRESKYGPTELEIGRHEVHQRIRQYAS
jgi:hypothetical protein